MDEVKKLEAVIHAAIAAHVTTKQELGAIKRAICKAEGISMTATAKLRHAYLGLC